MTQPCAVLKICERVESALKSEDPVRVEQSLRELAEVLEDDSFNSPTSDIIEKQTRELAIRVGLGSDMGLEYAGGLPNSFKGDVATIILRVCLCYLRTADTDSEVLPELSQNPEDIITAVETVAKQQVELEAQTLRQAVLAKSIAAEREAFAETIEESLEALSEIDTDQSHIEGSQEWRQEFTEKEREAAKLREDLRERRKEFIEREATKERMKKKASELRKLADDDGEQECDASEN